MHKYFLFLIIGISLLSFSAYPAKAQDLNADPSRTNILNDNNDSNNNGNNGSAGTKSKPPITDDSLNVKDNELSEHELEPKSAKQVNTPLPPVKVDFKNASDEQIKEAQLFYKKCKKNATLNSQHDCRCLAGEYLGARMILGDSASYKKVFSSIKTKCLRDGNESLPEGEVGMGEEYTDAQIKEATSVYNECKNDPFMRTDFDCRCIAANFIKKRKEMGPIADKTEVMIYIKNDCRNDVETAGYIYTKCMSGSAPMLVKNIKKYCECYAKGYATAYKKHKGKLSMAQESMLDVMARGKCSAEQR